MKKRRVVFLTGTRADFGKIKPLIESLNEVTEIEVHIFVTGMHLEQKYGYTVGEIYKCNFDNIHEYSNSGTPGRMDIALSESILGFSGFVRDMRADLVVVHGDRPEALAGAIVGSMNNVLVAHIEGGELSGTVDELVRHAVSKMSHVHFVSNEKAEKRLRQSGEAPESIFVIGSPDIDVMKRQDLPSIECVKLHYEIPFENFALALFHPVTTEYEKFHVYADSFRASLEASNRNYVVIYPNNDLGNDKILANYDILAGNPRFKIFPSLRFEYFLTLLKHSDFMIGNSSAGIREAPFFGVPTINIGSRQINRSEGRTISNCGYDKSEILKSITEIPVRTGQTRAANQAFEFGVGNSATLFTEALLDEKIWGINLQKQFLDL